MTAHRFMEPLDVLFLRGNKLFGDPGSYGESLVPPWPSVAAGAIRSRILADERVDLQAFASGQIVHPALGKPDSPGPFTVSGFYLARQVNGKTEILHPLPADLIVISDDNGNLHLQRLQPQPLADSIASSGNLPKVPVLAVDDRAKAVPGLWLTTEGWQRYLAGELPETGHLVESGSLWRIDPRIGIGLKTDQRCADDGKLFTVQAVAMADGCGFVVTVEGAEPPAEGLLRLGGDGRAAAICAVDCDIPVPDFEAIAAAGRCRMILNTPGLFTDGWWPTGCDGEGRFVLGGVTGQLVCAAVPRAETISGWDLARKQPKPAQRVAPIGSVYWIEGLDASAEELSKLVATGLWPDRGYDATRRAEGFNRFTFATY